MYKVCDPLYAKTVRTSKNRDNENMKGTDKTWFDNECQAARNLFYRNLNAYRADKNKNESG